MRIVLDTNVLMSGIFWSGPPFEILKRWKKGEVIFVVSPGIIEEYLRVGDELGRDYPGTDAGPILDLLIAQSEICLPDPLPHPVCRDPDDDKFIACALSAKTDYLVSGDKDLLVVSGQLGVKIVKAKPFLNLLT